MPPLSGGALPFHRQPQQILEAAVGDVDVDRDRATLHALDADHRARHGHRRLSEHGVDALQNRVAVCPVDDRAIARRQGDGVAADRQPEIRRARRACRLDAFEDAAEFAARCEDAGDALEGREIRLRKLIRAVERGEAGRSLLPRAERPRRADFSPRPRVAQLRIVGHRPIRADGGHRQLMNTELARRDAGFSGADQERRVGCRQAVDRPVAGGPRSVRRRLLAGRATWFNHGLALRARRDEDLEAVDADVVQPVSSPTAEADIDGPSEPIWMRGGTSWRPRCRTTRPCSVIRGAGRKAVCNDSSDTSLSRSRVSAATARWRSVSDVGSQTRAATMTAAMPRRATPPRIASHRRGDCVTPIVFTKRGGLSVPFGTGCYGFRA